MQWSPFSRQLDDLDDLDRVDRYAFGLYDDLQ